VIAPIPPSPSLKEDNATASSAAGGSKLSKDSLSLAEARHMSKIPAEKGGIAEGKKRVMFEGAQKENVATEKHPKTSTL
jgi:hypothetical protein